VYGGEAVLSPTPVSPSYWLHDDTVRHAEFNAEQAAALLDSMDLEDLTLEIIVNAESPERARIAETLAKNLEAIGIAVHLFVLPGNEFNSRLSSGDFDIFFGRYNLSPLPDLRFMLHSQNIGSTNVIRYRDPVMDRFLQDVMDARSDETMLQAFSTLQNYIAYEMPLIGLVFQTSALLVSDRVQGFPDGCGVFSNIEDWYIKTR
jgi:ABC-type transport system substrate-binding protein